MRCHALLGVVAAVRALQLRHGASARSASSRRTVRPLRMSGGGGGDVSGPVVLVGAPKYGAALASLALEACGELGGAAVGLARGAALGEAVARAGPGDVVYCVDDQLKRADWRAVERTALSVWVRSVTEFGNDDVCEIFREARHRARARYEVAARAPEGPTGDSAESFGGGGAEVARLARFGSCGRLGADDVRLEAGLDTFFVSCTFDDYGTDAAEACLRALAADAAVSAVEFRCDLLRSLNPGAVLRELRRVRAATATSWRGEKTPAKVMFRAGEG